MVVGLECLKMIDIVPVIIGLVVLGARDQVSGCDEVEFAVLQVESAGSGVLGGGCFGNDTTLSRGILVVSRSVADMVEDPEIILVGLLGSTEELELAV